MNPEFELAEQFALYTSHHCFITGKAGSGKTTLLKSVAKKTAKKFVIVAPTGVAAINAGGVTIHSQFNLPLSSFIPSSDWVDLNVVTNRRALIEHMKFRKDKRKVIQEVEMLIIDEVSMVRADILDAIDFVMRTVRRNSEPFGGVQVILLGDMHQLPPVVKENEWMILKNYYRSPYFFDSKVWEQLDAAEIELKKIYRQSDERFLRLLNNIRHRDLDEDDYDKLRERYNPDYKPTETGYIVLATHNNKAQKINDTELSALDSIPSVFDAEITGDFPEHIYPCEKHLLLKNGAQVMFTRNDAEEGRYFNGKLATVENISGNQITVSFNDSGEEYVLKKAIWENVSYTVDESSEEINKNVLGTFSQFPLRLAWAITIHKSQGLTFEKVIIDAGNSFAAGQVYVALSRCRTLEGIILHSMITPASLHTDERIVGFSDNHHTNNELENMLHQAKNIFTHRQLKQVFAFHKLYDRITEWRDELLQKPLPDKDSAIELFEKIVSGIEQIEKTASKFNTQLDQLLHDYVDDGSSKSVLLERCNKAIQYFTTQIHEVLIVPVHSHIEKIAYKSKVKRYVKQVQLVEENLWAKIEQLYQARLIDEKIFSGEEIFKKEKLTSIDSSVTSGKKEIGGTYKDTLKLFKQGLTIKEIAEVRSLAIATVKGHLGRWIASGDLQIDEVLAPEIRKPIEEFLVKNEEKTVAAVFRQFGEKYDGNDVRLVISYLQKTNQ